MIKDDWYRNRTWNGRIDSNFEDQMKRSRGSSNKAEYLQVQGGYLLNNPHKNIQEVGVALLHRLFEDFPAEHHSIILAREILGDFYLRQKNYERAAHFFRLVTNDCLQQKSRSGTSTMADLKLAESILRDNKADQLEAAYALVIDYPVELLRSAEHKFYHAELAAHICDALHKTADAKAFAITAIGLYKLVKPSAVHQNTSSPGKFNGQPFRSLLEISRS